MSRQLKIGIIGIGVGAAEILPAMESMPELDLMAGADLSTTYPNPHTLQLPLTSHVLCGVPGS